LLLFSVIYFVNVDSINRKRDAIVYGRTAYSCGFFLQSVELKMLCEKTGTRISYILHVKAFFQKKTKVL